MLEFGTIVQWLGVCLSYLEFSTQHTLSHMPPQNGSTNKTKKWGEKLVSVVVPVITAHSFATVPMQASSGLQELWVLCSLVLGGPG